MNKPIIKLSSALSLLIFAISAESAFASTVLKTAVTTALGPDFFFYDAATGAQDYTINEPATANFERNFGALNVGTSGTELTVTGVGWATSTSVSDNDA